MGDIVEYGIEVVDAMISDRTIEPGYRLAGLVMFAAFEYGPRAGLIAKRLGADLAEVGEIVERLDGAEYWGPFRPGRHRGIAADWPEMIGTDGTDAELMSRCVIAFCLDVLVAVGLVERKRDEGGEFTYWPCAELSPAAEGEKECTVCGTRKPLSGFHRRGDRGTYFSQCKACRSGRQKDWRQRVLERENPRCAVCGGPRGYGSFAPVGKCRACYAPA
jgi:hypothetical protein